MRLIALWVGSGMRLRAHQRARSRRVRSSRSFVLISIRQRAQCRTRRCSRFARQDHAKPASLAAIQEGQPLPGHGQDVWLVPRLRRGSRHAVEAWRSRRSKQYAMADEGGRKGEGSLGIAASLLAGALATPIQWNSQCQCGGCVAAG
jgi:hypothetical protein